MKTFLSFIVTLCIASFGYCQCEGPQNVETNILDPVVNVCKVLVDWDSPCPPGSETDWLEWDDLSFSQGIGLTAGGSFRVAVRFTPEQLVEYTNGLLTKIRLFPAEAGGSFVLKVWTGPNASQLVASQFVNSYTPGQWNEFSLNTPIEITGTTEVWFGYELTAASGLYIAGADDGPAIAGYGDLISTDGVTWQSMASQNENHNWNLGAFVNYANPSDTCLVTGYNIYRSGEWIATTTETQYIDDLESSRADLCYGVSAIYQDCESELSNLSCIVVFDDCIVGSENNILPEIAIYPNPAKDLVTFSFTDDIEQFLIYDIIGNIVEKCKINSGQLSLVKDLKAYPDGLYLIKFISKEGVITGRKLIKK